MHHLLDLARWAFGLDVPSPRDYGVLQSCLRAVLIYAAGLVILRVGEHRSLRRGGVFDLVLAFVLGSTLSRAINGSAALWPTIGVAILLVGVHRLIGAAAFRSHHLGSLVKGDAALLLQDGEIRPEAMRRFSISRRDLEEGLRLHEIARVEEAAEAWIERNGDISAVRRQESRAEPRVVEVAVEAGVQRIRIEIG
jgi:uncharacterized membrane protein YcaP (DUF421 family)